MPEHPMLPNRTSTATLTKINVGTNVIVRIRYSGTWSGGFVVVGVVDTGYILGRLSDGYVLPDVFAFDDVRLERRKDPFRGIARSYLDRRW